MFRASCNAWKPCMQLWILLWQLVNKWVEEDSWNYCEVFKQSPFQCTTMYLTLYTSPLVLETHFLYSGGSRNQRGVRGGPLKRIPNNNSSNLLPPTCWQAAIRVFRSCSKILFSACLRNCVGEVTAGQFISPNFLPIKPRLFIGTGIYVSTLF